MRKEMSSNQRENGPCHCQATVLEQFVLNAR